MIPSGPPPPPCQSGNPAIDTVPLIDCAVPTDQRGVPRPQDAACDIGAFEFGPLPPVAVSDTATTSANTPVTINVLANDTDPNPTDILTVTMVTMPVNGIAVISGTTHVTYTPNTNFSGQDVFTYTVCDGIRASAAVVTVTVLSKLYLPIIQR